MSQTAFAEPAYRSPPEPDALEPRSEAGRRVCEETYWNEYYLQSDVHYEWNDGVLEEKPVSDYQTYCVYRWLLRLLDTFLAARPIGKLIGLEMGFRLALPTGVVIRKPDMAVVRDDNPSALLPREPSYHGIFDLCVEALSTSNAANIRRDAVQKHGEYQAAGVPEYYIVHAEPERQAFYTRNAAGLYVPIVPRHGVIHSLVLPGFRFRLADLCTRPTDEALRDDPVYADFVLPGWRTDRERADAAQRQAEQQRQRAERLAARLRAMGIDPDQPDEPSD